ncbi:uncharacterized protein [Glycine max]|uniref:uncharacterized protein isoform X1 n=1 Tax=Glycine max TaxID=3847 RepID=UPI0007190E34|nr:uncharacterized protein LOC100792303 isoform X1 [Glycine max]|eukprot:XP_014618864.1 uncharacterized protein LOC100792303 isoform X1 [Glycine max]
MERRGQQYYRGWWPQDQREQASLQEKQEDLILQVNLLYADTDGPLTETLSAPFASSKCTRMLSTATPVLTLKEFVQCVESKFLIPSFTNKAMCSGYLCCIACCIFF